MNPERAFDITLRLAPLVLSWIRDLVDAGQSEDDIRRDITDRRVEIAKMRRDRNDQFAEKFGK